MVQNRKAQPKGHNKIYFSPLYYTEYFLRLPSHPTAERAGFKTNLGNTWYMQFSKHYQFCRWGEQ